MNDTFVDLRLVRAGCSRLGWAEGQTFRIPRALLQSTRLAQFVSRDGAVSLPDQCDAATPADAHALREFAAFTESPPTTARLPVSYRRVPGTLRAAAASLIGRLRRRQVDRWARFPRWPLDLSADFLSDVARERCAVPPPTPVVLTHDIDSAEGLTNLTRNFLDREEAAGARSVNYVVPRGWTLDAAALREIRARGHEIGVHGFDHSNRTPFLDPAARRERLAAGRRFADEHGATGYRAPSLLRTRALVRDVGERFAYDSSIPTSGGLFPVPNNGCASARPFVVEGTLELPLSMPRDGSLRFLGYSAAEILQLWIDCAAAIAQSGGVVVLLTHCERRFSGASAMLDAYSRLLEHFGSADGYRFSQPADVLVRPAA